MDKPPGGRSDESAELKQLRLIYVPVECSPYCCVRVEEKFTAGFVVAGREVFYVFKIERKGPNMAADIHSSVYVTGRGDLFM